MWAATLFAVLLGASEVHVSPQGQDGAAGTATAPLATLAAALAKGRQDPPATVVLHAGRYELAAPLALTAADRDLSLVAAPGERPVVSGGLAVRGWQRQADGSYTLALPPGTGDVRELFLLWPDGRCVRRYRPTRGALVVAGLTNAPTKPGATMAHRQSQDEFRFHPADFAGVTGDLGAEVVAFHDWSASRLRIREIDTTANIVRFTGYPIYRIGHWYAGGRNPYFIENARADAGQPGRFYQDRAAGLLRYTPLPGEDLGGAAAIVPRATQLLIANVAAGAPLTGLRLAGLTFAHTNWSLPPAGYSSGQGMVDLPAAIDLLGVQGATIRGCTFTQVAGYGLRLGEGSSSNTVEGCRFVDLGGGGLLVGVTDPKATPPKLPVDNRIEHCFLADGGLQHFSAHGIWIGIAQRTVVRGNLLQRWPYSGISCGWVWGDGPSSCRDNTIAQNEIATSMTLLADGGAIYTLGRQPGMLLEGNLIHDVQRSRFTGRAPNNGFFFDEGSKEFRCVGNVIYATSGTPVRHNRNAKEDHTWVDNSLGVAPGQPGFPAERAAAAGLPAAWRQLTAGYEPPLPSPVTLLTLPVPPPVDFRDGFEDYAAETTPRGLTVQGEDVAKGATMRVTSAVAASGKQCLAYRDAPGLPKPFYPYGWWEPRIAGGTAEVGLQVRLTAGARLQIEGRHLVDGGFRSGPVVSLEPGGGLRVGQRQLTVVPLDTWIGLSLTVPLGEAAAAGWTLAVQSPTGRQTFDKLAPADAGFRHLDWLGLIAHAEAAQVVYVDDLVIREVR